MKLGKNKKNPSKKNEVAVQSKKDLAKNNTDARLEELKAQRKEELARKEEEKRKTQQIIALRRQDVEIMASSTYIPTKMETLKYRIKRTKLFRYFDFKNLGQEIGGIENDFSFKKYILTLILVPLFALAASTIYKLDIAYGLIVAVAFLFFVPSLVLSTVKQNYQKRKFSEANSYIEQMIYSFKRNGKILAALQDTQQIANGSMRETIDAALSYIIRGNAVGKNRTALYKEALSIIEDEYKCTRIMILHSFLINIEASGGSYGGQISILLEDAREWATRNMSFQQDIKNLKSRTIMSEVMAIILCAVMLYVIPAEQMANIVPTVFYQLLTTGVMIMFMLLYVIIQQKLTGSWLDLDGVDPNKDKEFDKDYQYCIEHLGDQGKRLLAIEQRKAYKKAVVFLIFVPACIMIDQPYFSIIPVLMAFIVASMPKKKLKGSKRRVAEQLQQAFPIWIRQLTLQLQSENVFNALVKSQEECPHAVKAELQKLILAITDNPNSNQPYIGFFDFLGDNTSNEMKRLVRSLYAMSEVGTDNAESTDASQLTSLIQQNAKLTDNAERLANSLKLDFLSTLTLAPMVIGTIKMFIDLALYCGTYMSYFQELSSTGLDSIQY